MAADKKAEMEAILKLQRDAFDAARPEEIAVRKDRIKRAMALVKDHGEELCKAMSADFGSRSVDQGMMTDIVSSVNFGKYCLKHIDKWARPEKRKVTFPLGLLGAKPHAHNRSDEHNYWNRWTCQYYSAAQRDDD